MIVPLSFSALVLLSLTLAAPQTRSVGLNRRQASLDDCTTCTAVIDTSKQCLDALPNGTIADGSFPVSPCYCSQTFFDEAADCYACSGGAISGDEAVYQAGDPFVALDDLQRGCNAAGMPITGTSRRNQTSSSSAASGSAIASASASMSGSSAMMSSASASKTGALVSVSAKASAVKSQAVASANSTGKASGARVVKGVSVVGAVSGLMMVGAVLI